MSNVLSSRDRIWLYAIKVSDGTIVQPDGDGYVTLTATNYVFVLRTTDQPLESLNIATDATIAFSSTGLIIETTNAPRDSGEAGTLPGSVTDYAASGTAWTQENPTTAYVGTSGTGWTVTNLTLTKTAGTGSAMIHLGNMGAARIRAYVTVTTGGTMRVAPHGKA